MWRAGTGHHLKASNNLWPAWLLSVFRVQGLLGTCKPLRAALSLYCSDLFPAPARNPRKGWTHFGAILDMVLEGRLEAAAEVAALVPSLSRVLMVRGIQSTFMSSSCQVKSLLPSPEKCPPKGGLVVLERLSATASLWWHWCRDSLL